MVSFGIILIVFFSMIVYGIYEYQKHQKNVNRIPIRIHINGTRGKSSVTRLIGAGLREGKINAITKVTGTFPRLILADGKETIIRRKAGANILEQLNIIKYAANKKADALLIECMALQPIFQKITEEQMVRATIGVITNIRLDHLDVMGPTIKEVGEALSETIPKNGVLFTSEDKHIKFLEKKCQLKNAKFNRSLATTISDEDMEGFNYIEHRDNVALALDICNHLGIDKKTALKGMKKMIPDEGVLIKNTVVINDKKINFYNAFAANDPESSSMIWKTIRNSVKNEQMVFLLTIRHDRQSRAIQLITLASTLKYDLVVLIGETTDIIEDKAKSLGIPKEKLVNKPWDTPEKIYNGLGDVVDENAVIVGIGNMGAMGAEVSQLFRKNQIKNN
jgi:poly-gamma-glutamate synthase PgsB/CapB